MSTSIHWAAGTTRWECSHEARQPVETSHAASPWPRVMNEIHFAPPFRPDDPSPISTNNGFLPMVSRIGFRPHLGSTRQNTLEMLEMSYPVHNVWHHPKCYRPPKALQVSLLAVGGRLGLEFCMTPWWFRVTHSPTLTHQAQRQSLWSHCCRRRRRRAAFLCFYVMLFVCPYSHMTGSCSIPFFGCLFVFFLGGVTLNCQAYKRRRVPSPIVSPWKSFEASPRARGTAAAAAARHARHSRQRGGGRCASDLTISFC